MVGVLVCTDSSAECDEIDTTNRCSKGASTIVPRSSLVDQAVVECHSSCVDGCRVARYEECDQRTEQRVQAKATPVRV
jgi:hypothetical protein